MWKIAGVLGLGVLRPKPASPKATFVVRSGIAAISQRA